MWLVLKYKPYARLCSPFLHIANTVLMNSSVDMCIPESSGNEKTQVLNCMTACARVDP